MHGPSFTAGGAASMKSTPVPRSARALRTRCSTRSAKLPQTPYEQVVDTTFTWSASRRLRPYEQQLERLLGPKNWRANTRTSAACGWR